MRIIPVGIALTDQTIWPVNEELSGRLFSSVLAVNDCCGLGLESPRCAGSPRLSDGPTTTRISDNVNGLLAHSRNLDLEEKMDKMGLMKSVSFQK